MYVFPSLASLMRVTELTATPTDAANDVHSSVQLFTALKNVAEANGIPLDLAEHCSYVGKTLPVSSRRDEPIRTKPYRSNLAIIPGAKPPMPTQLEALELFRSGLSTHSVAETKSIKISTAR